MGFQGKFRDLSLVDILQVVQMTQKSGVLKIVEGAKRASIIFKDGNIVDAHPSGKGRLAEELVRGGLVGKPALEAALESRKPDERIGQALVRAGVIDEAKLKAVLVARVEGAVYDALSWIGGEFEFEMTGEGPAQPLVQYEDLLPGVNFNTQEVLMDALRVFDERKAGRAAAGESPPPSPGAIEPPPESTSNVAIQAPPAVVTASRIIQADRALLIVAGPPTFRDLVRIAVSRLGAELAECSDLADVEARVEAESKRAILVVLHAEGNVSTLPERIARLVLAARRIAVLTAGSDPRVAGAAVHAGAFAHVDLLPSDPGPPLSYLQTLAAERLAILASGKATPPPAPPPSSNGAGGAHPDLPEELRTLRTRLDSLTGEIHTQSVSLRIMEFVAERLDRGVLFLVRPNDLQGLGAFGHTAEGDPLGPLASGLRLPLEKGSAFRRAIDERTTLLCELGASAAEKELYARIGSPSPSDALLLPLISVGNVVALVYADNGTTHRDIKDVELLEVLARQAGLVLENALLRKMLNRAT